MFTRLNVARIWLEYKHYHTGAPKALKYDFCLKSGMQSYLQGRVQSRSKIRIYCPIKASFVQYSIELALNIQQISKVLVTTDSEEILAIANELGVVGVRRPESACRDESRDSEYLYHLADFMPDLKLNKPDALLLRPLRAQNEILQTY